MTVSYQYKVASSTSGGFTRLLFLWRGSLYKLIYRELLIFLVAFDVLSVLYRNLFTEEQKEIFEKLVTYCDTFINLIPLTFILGFYVAYVAARWWQQYEAIPWPDKTMHTIALYLPGNDEHIRILRRTLMRYLNLTLVLVLRSISSAVKKRFPSVDHLIDVGFMTPTEKQIFLSVPNNEFNTYWIPCTWFIHVLRDVKAEYPDLDPHGIKLIMEEFNEFRAKCGLLWSYDWISIPLVYTQVVTLATYSFFAAAVIGRQFVEHSKKAMQMEIDIYVPVFTILQFFFFMGLLKVAEQLINPFGDDDEDFELNWLIDRHTKVSYLGVDTLMLQRPPLVKDKYFDKFDLVLPYTTASVIHKKKTFRGSVHFMQIPENQQDMYLPEIIEEENDSQYAPQKNRRPSLFSKVFLGMGNKNAQFTEKEDIFTTGSWRQTADGIENGKNCRKKSSIEVDETTISLKNRNSNLGSVSNHKPTFQAIDCPLTNVSIHSLKDSDSGSSARRKVTKHSSLQYGSDRRITRRCEKGIHDRRRKSFPAMMFHKDSGTLSRNSSKWSLRKDSLVDSHWKGIRWKPFLREEEKSEQINTSSLEDGKFDDRNERHEYSYVNKAFTNSTPEGIADSKSACDNNTIRIENEKELASQTGQVTDCDKKSKSTPKYLERNKALQDSLV